MISDSLSAQSACEPAVSIGIIAWNEAEVIGATLGSLLQQDLFAELGRRGETAEIICIANGCTDGTAAIARSVLETHPGPLFASGRVVELAERGKLNAWNRFVHNFSARRAPLLILMDADIVFREPETLRRMCGLLETHPGVSVAVDRPVKDIALTGARGWRAWLSRSASTVTQGVPGRMSGQLYAIRSAVARNIYLPRDLGACDDGFIKALVCTDFFTHPVVPGRIQCAPGASHTFAAYVGVGDLIRNRRRQMIGQTMVHLLVDGCLSRIPVAWDRCLAETIHFQDQVDPAWLKRLLAVHLHRTRWFWRLYPGLLTARGREWRGLPWRKRLTCLPALGADFALNLICAWQARRLLRRGATDYWPDTRSPGLAKLSRARPTAAPRSSVLPSSP